MRALEHGHDLYVFDGIIRVYATSAKDATRIVEDMVFDAASERSEYQGQTTVSWSGPRALGDLAS